jgi:hypothetical protein
MEQNREQLKPKHHAVQIESWNLGWDLLKDPKIQSILLVGCGGGFDFVHSLLFYDDLIKLGKKIYVGSYSFGDPLEYSDSPELVPIFQSKSSDPSSSISPYVVRITSSCRGSEYYCPELGYCSYLDSLYPENSPHSIYAYYARAFTTEILSHFYSQLITEHHIDAIIAVDGGSDSLMRGDENGLGDPIEDAVSVSAIASLCCSVKTFQESSPPQPLGLLYSVGLGCDRFNSVSDSSSLRAVAELTQRGGFLGSYSFIHSGRRVEIYRNGLTHIYQRQQMRSILSGSILASAYGHYGSEIQSPDGTPEIDFGTRLLPPTSPSTSGSPGTDELFVWPLMSMLWMFDITIVAERSLICKWISSATTVKEAQRLFDNERRRLYDQKVIRRVERLPTPRLGHDEEVEAEAGAQSRRERNDEGPEEERVKKCAIS